jgi:hypothetical protein
MAAQRHDRQVLDALVAIALDPAQPAAARVTACREVLDTLYGFDILRACAREMAAPLCFWYVRLGRLVVSR